MITRFPKEVIPNWEGLKRCIMREGAPDRVYHIELFLDPEMQDAVSERFGLLKSLDPNDPYYPHRKQIEIQSFLGYDFVRWSLERQEWPLNYDSAQDTAQLTRSSGRNFVNMHRGPITNWEEFERYPWPAPSQASTQGLEWFEENLPENMCVMGSGGFAHFAEHLTWLMGYETCCMALMEQRDLVEAIAKRLLDYYVVFMKRLLAFDRVKITWGSDDMGFRSGPLLSPADLREFVLSGHAVMARMAHEAGRPYLLHSCGNLSLLMDELIEDVKIDAKHSFEDTIEDVRDAKRAYGHRIALLGGIDVDFLCRSSETEIRKRVRDTLDVCMPGGGYCLGTGNSVANYIPLDSYLTMLDEGRRY
ncbi:MAG TPA: uroporphyrinogen decarboxylase family protein [Candidatus Hydrogenedentes bacterium]|nr:uroporphyrinogen decarboxylase family protein [Candidatus Hydrogenedentota bacterium]